MRRIRSRWPALRSAPDGMLEAAGIVVAHHGETPADFAALKVLAEALRPTDATRSRECWERAHREAPDDPETLFFLGDFCREAGEYERAVALFERALALAPDHPALLNNLGLAREKVGVSRPPSDATGARSRCRPMT